MISAILLPEGMLQGMLRMLLEWSLCVVTTGGGRAAVAPTDILCHISACCGLSGACALKLAVSAILYVDAVANNASSSR